jgi:hypothetical protein
MDETKNTYYTPEFLENLKKVVDNISPETWHKIMNPMCPQCLIERFPHAEEE